MESERERRTLADADLARGCCATTETDKRTNANPMMKCMMNSVEMFLEY